MIEIAKCLVRRVVDLHPDNNVAKKILSFLSSGGDIEKLDWIYLFSNVVDANKADDEHIPMLFDRGTHKDFRIQSLSIRGFRKYPYKEDCTYEIDFRQCNKKDVCSCYYIGNNGTGKTSIFSALQEICSDCVTAAETRDIAKLSYMPHIGVNLKSIDATIITNEGKVEFQNPELSALSNYRKFLRPFFCSEYDITVMARTKDITEYVIQQTGYKKAYALIQILDKIKKECKESAIEISERLYKQSRKKKISPQDYGILRELMNESFASLVQLKIANDNKGRADNLHKIATLLRNNYSFKKPRLASKSLSSDLLKLSENLSILIGKLEEERQKMISLDIYNQFINSQYSTYTNHCSEIVAAIHNLSNMGESNSVIKKEQLMSINDLAKTLAEANLNTIRNLYANLLDELANSIDKRQNAQEYIRNYLSLIDKLYVNESEIQRIRLSDEDMLNIIDSNNEHLKQCIDELRALFYQCVHKALHNAGEVCKQILEEFNMEGENLQVEFDKDKTQLRIEYEIEKKRMEPALLLNSFRFRLYTLCVKVSMAFSVMQIMNLSFPLVFDDVFYSSDFVNREKVNEFFEKIFTIYHMQFKDDMPPLQILFFTHDEIVLESAIKGTLSSPQNDTYKYGRIFNYQEMEPEKGKNKTCPLAVIYGTNE